MTKTRLRMLIYTVSVQYNSSNEVVNELTTFREEVLIDVIGRCRDAMHFLVFLI